MGKLLFTLLAVLLVGGLVSNCNSRRAAERAAAEKAATAATLAAADARRNQLEREACDAERETLLAAARAALARGEPFDKLERLERCAIVHSGLLPEIQPLLPALKIAMYTAIARDRTNTPDARIEALYKIELFDRAEFKRLAPLLEQVRRAQQAERAALAKAEAAQRRKQGVRIGMTREEVLASSWGKPQKVNTTTTAYSVREQWVYGDGNYLYFKDGILTSIQH